MMEALFRSSRDRGYLLSGVQGVIAQDEDPTFMSSLYRLFIGINQYRIPAARITSTATTCYRKTCFLEPEMCTTASTPHADHAVSSGVHTQAFEFSTMRYYDVVVHNCTLVSAAFWVFSGCCDNHDIFGDSDDTNTMRGLPDVSRI